MEITVEELNKLLQKEFERGKQSANNWNNLQYNWNIIPVKTNIPIACRTCPKHPSNGGDGICHCTFSSQGTITYSTTDNIKDTIS